MSKYLSLQDHFESAKVVVGRSSRRLQRQDSSPAEPSATAKAFVISSKTFAIEKHFRLNCRTSISVFGVHRKVERGLNEYLGKLIIL